MPQAGESSQMNHGYPGSQVSGKAISPAPFFAASLIKPTALSIDASRSRNTGAAWIAAARNFG